MYLFINTAEQNRITVGLIESDFLFDKIIEPCQWQESEKLVPLINRVIKKNKLTLKKLKGIIVVKGPGGFTSLRIGVITANTLSYSLKIPVVGVRLGQGMIKQGIKRIKKLRSFRIIEPHYGRPPNITKPKKNK
ncbi:MAG: tRNA (adenosine(37)-N6)-threonylcarbamoyltransferase complex dimerization subunit type 1 TsaB [Patescibacteria group bacterium]